MKQADLTTPISPAEIASFDRILTIIDTGSPTPGVEEGGKKEAGLPTLGLLLPEEDLEKASNEEGFVTWSRLRSEFRAIATALFTALVVGRAA